MKTENSGIKISTLTGKLKGFRALNTNTLSNEFCSKMRNSDAVCRKCYSAAMLQGVRQNCIPPWEKNSKILSGSVLEKDQLPVILDKVFRFHAHGELINSNHLENYINICRKNSDTVFALWTKRKNLISDYVKSGRALPDNLILIYSNPKTNKVLTRVPVNFDKVFNASDSGRVSRGQIECTGKDCAACMACYVKDNGKNIIVEKVK